MEENINALDEIHKGACMGIDAIDYVIDKVSDKGLKKELLREQKDYKRTKKYIEDIYNKYSEGNPHETGVMTKAMTWGSVELKTFVDTSSSKISELILQGVNMGIIEGRKILNKKCINEEISNIIEEYVAMQEKSVEILKEYL